MELTEKQKKLVGKEIEKFKKFTTTSEYLELLQERENREAFYKTLTPEKIGEMSEVEFSEIISKLWASQIWGNKDYLVGNIISQNGLDKIKTELKKLLFGTESVDARYDNFSIKGLGPASTTEILCYSNPEKFGIWNDKARKALSIMGFEETLPLSKYQINGKEYIKFNEVLQKISDFLKHEAFEKVDLLYVDYFLYDVWLNNRLPSKKEEVKAVKFDHNEIRDKVQEVGVLLGFETDVEKLVAKGARVDVIWKAKISNLGVVSYIFEVQKGGSIDSLLINLQKAKNDPTVQKVIAVSDSEQIEKIKNEAEELSEDFRKSLAYWNVSEVDRAFELLSEVNSIINKLDLVKK